MLQLHTPIPVETPKGAGFAHLIIDYGQEHNLLFVCFINDTGECWTFSTKDIRLEKNLTMGILFLFNATAATEKTEPRRSAMPATSFDPGVAAFAGS